MHRALVLLALLALLGHLARSPAAVPALPARLDAAPAPAPLALTDYLALLERIAPAARAGAEDYLAAFARRCGRALTVSELRHAVADGAGDPVLLGLIRARQTGDEAARARLARTLACPAEGAR